jgi:hypothetical protein
VQLRDRESRERILEVHWWAVAPTKKPETSSRPAVERERERERERESEKESEKGG